MNFRFAVPLAAAAALSAATLSAPAMAQDAPAATGLSFELNRALDIAPADGAEAGSCSLIIVAANRIPQVALDKVAIQMAVFDAGGVVTRLLVLDFGALPEGKTKIQQFVIPEQSCDDISRIVVNDVTECRSGDNQVDCLPQTAVSSRASIQFGL